MRRDRSRDVFRIGCLGRQAGQRPGVLGFFWLRRLRDLGGHRSRWVVSGPGGVPVQWTAVLTEREEHRLLAWRSEPGSVLENAGVVRFAREGAGTRVDFRFCYSPPAGELGEAVAELLGDDPRTQMNHDLNRVKTLLEAPNGDSQARV